MDQQLANSLTSQVVQELLIAKQYFDVHNTLALEHLERAKHQFHELHVLVWNQVNAEAYNGTRTETRT